MASSEKPQPFERLLFLLGHKDTGSGSQEWAYKAAADGWCGLQRKGYQGEEEGKTCTAEPKRSFGCLGKHFSVVCACFCTACKRTRRD